MNWKECAANRENFEGFGARFKWPSEGVGFDCNVASTFNDISGMLGWIWTWPGDYILSQEPVQSFFELPNATVIGSGWSIVLGSVLFVAALTVLSLLFD